ncbi:retrotransposon protein, putative, ty1-copia subclass [Tanacetum coccineum]
MMDILYYAQSSYRHATHRGYEDAIVVPEDYRGQLELKHALGDHTLAASWDGAKTKSLQWDESLIQTHYPTISRVTDTSPSEITSEIPMKVEGFEPLQEEVILVRSYKAAMLDSESNKWIDVMNAEIQSMTNNMVWVLVDLPHGNKTVRSKWIFKKKTDMDGIVHTYKARLVAKGYTQLYGVDYEETFSPVADIRAIRILISIAAFYDYEIWQMDMGPFLPFPKLQNKGANTIHHLPGYVLSSLPDKTSSPFLLPYVDQHLYNLIPPIATLAILSSPIRQGIKTKDEGL